MTAEMASDGRHPSWLEKKTNTERRYPDSDGLAFMRRVSPAADGGML